MVIVTVTVKGKVRELMLLLVVMVVAGMTVSKGGGGSGNDSHRGYSKREGEGGCGGSHDDIIGDHSRDSKAEGEEVNGSRNSGNGGGGGGGNNDHGGDRGGEGNGRSGFDDHDLNEELKEFKIRIFRSLPRSAKFVVSLRCYRA